MTETTTQESRQRFIPYLAYENAPAALDFLCEAFGFAERSRMPMPDGRIGHAEVVHGDQVLYLASVYPEFGLAAPMNLEAVHCQIFCYVDEIDAHFEKSKAAGAIIVSEPENQEHGTRTYRAMDPEGHRWMFSTTESAA